MGFDSSDPRQRMWGEALQLLEQADRLQRRFFHVGSAGRGRWEPPVDIYESEDAYWILVALPGVNPQHVEVLVEGATLIVHGERPLPVESRTGAIRRLEIPYGAFERRLQLPAGRFELSTKHLENGCLLVGLRKLG